MNKLILLTIFLSIFAFACEEDIEKKEPIITDNCQKISFKNIVSDGYDKNASVYTDKSLDYNLIFEFYESTPIGEYDLNSLNKNDNFKTCKQCLLITKDDKKFYPKSGTIEVTQGDAFEGNSKGDIKSVKLIEVLIDDTFNSTPVEDGECLTIDISKWDTTSYTFCENGEKRCKDDKLETCTSHVWKVTNDCTTDGGHCNEDNKECVTSNNCIGLSFDSIVVNKDFATSYQDRDGDYELSIDFYTSTPAGSYDLSDPRNSNYANCDQCVLIKNGSKRFFQREGIIKIISGEATTGNSKAEITSLRLLEVKIDDNQDSSIIIGGACLEVETIFWDTL